MTVLTRHLEHSAHLRRRVRSIRELPAVQQPDWGHSSGVDDVRAELEGRTGPVSADELVTLRALLAEVAAGRFHVLQAGDCAEDPAECEQFHVARKAALLDLLASTMALRSRTPVLRVGRIAGQFGKPRSRPTEIVDGVELPVYRGHMVNGPLPIPSDRRADPLRLLAGADAAALAHDALRRHRADVASPLGVWTSHEALLLDYETPLLRHDDSGSIFLSSTHWPWIGERTRQLDGAHVALLAAVSNPVGCKVGPTMGTDELVRLCDVLDPWREPGRLALIARMGHEHTRTTLASLVAAVRTAGHPVLWMCDPMHANTITTGSGHKTRLVTDLVTEVTAFRAAVAEGGGVAAGLHLETTPDAVLECVNDATQQHVVGARFESLCDPRLNPEQAVTVVSAWQDA